VTPTTAIWGLVAGPFAVRLFIAWSVMARVRGWAFTANVAPRVESTDFPIPNSPIREGVLYLVSMAVAAVVAPIAESAFAPAAPRLVWPLLFWPVAASCFAWAYLRLRSDDRRWLDLKTKRIAARAAALSASSDIGEG
jgi:hypothetical protein